MTITKKTRLLAHEGLLHISVGPITASPYTAIIHGITHPEGVSGYFDRAEPRMVNVSVKYPNGQVFVSQYVEQGTEPTEWIGMVSELGPAEVGSVFEFTITPDPAKADQFDQTPIVRRVTITEG